MRKYLSLVKLLFVQQYKFRSTQDGKKGKRKQVGTTVALIILALCFLPLLIAIAVAMYYMGLLTEGNVYVGTFLTLTCQGFVLMFAVHALISNVFVVRDADKLMYLPIRSHTIFLAKLTVAFLNEVITTAVTLLVVLLPFGIGAGASFAYYLMLVIALFIIPMLPMLIGCLIAMPFSALISRFGKNSAVKTILRILIYVVIMALYLYAMYSFGFITGSENGNILDNPEVYIRDMASDFIENLKQIMPYFQPNHMLMKSMLASTFVDWLVGFSITIGENIVLLGIVFLISLPFYRRMLTLSIEDGGIRRKKQKEQYKFKNGNVVKSLMLTDLKRTVRDGQLGFQSFAGIVMMPIIVVIFYFFMGVADEGDASFLNIVAVSSLYQVLAPLVLLAYMCFIGLSTNVLGLFPISRENTNVSILKSLPVSFNKILLAKVLLATAVMVISDFVTCLLIVILLGVKWYYGLVLLITLSLLGFGSMCITTLTDLKNPRFGWENFNHGLKNSKNSWIAMFIAMMAVIGIMLISVWFVVWYVLVGGWYVTLLMWLVILGAGFAFAWLSYKIMTDKATQYFESIEI